LTIDVHAHVFNASDLQIDAFLRSIIARGNPAISELGPVLQEMGWSSAPDANDERRALMAAATELKECRQSVRINQVEGFRQNGYARGRAELKRALGSAQAKRRIGARRLLDDSGVAAAITSLPPSEKDYRATRGARARSKGLRGGIDVEGAIAFVLQQFQFRYVNVSEYLETYSAGRTRKVDLLIAHMVDYDWPIARGRPTPTSLDQQVDLMADIAVATGGRVHAFAPFDPMREVAYRLGLESRSSLALVRRAVESRGCIGVKLYPPMGFAAFGNSDRQASFWRRNWIRSDLVRDDFGARLDEALADLYRWCLAEDVPIMAHTNISNGPVGAFEALVSPLHWEAARDAFPGLRLNFGHFGDTSPTARDGEPGLKLAALMTAAPDSPGRNLYADAGYFAESLSRPQALQQTLRRLYRLTAAKDTAPLAQRLMYGTDWLMTLIEGPANESYLARFEEIFSALDRDPSLGARGQLSNRFFGRNAMEFLGLRRREKTRDRLERFYARHGVSAPSWTAKVDDISG
jgi:predicted TIM-barrel fold metal-dependent hydrolase